MKAEEVLAIIERHRDEQGGLISMLEEIQSRYSYLPEEALRMVASASGHSLVDVYGVATFYRAFSLKPRGRHLVQCCLGTACHVRGAPGVVTEIEHQLGIHAGETTADREFTLETVNCLGACALGPIVVADGHYFSNVNTVRVAQILRDTRRGLDKVEVTADERVFPVNVSCPRCNRSLMDATHTIDGYPSIRVTVACNDVYGWLRLSCLWGSPAVESEREIPLDAVTNFFCPHCSAQLLGGGYCPVCRAPVVPLVVPAAGVVKICSRRGCRYHMLDLEREPL